MIEVYENPTNKSEFEGLKIFAKEVLDLLTEKGVNPIAYGSLNLFGHIRDGEMEVKDINLLVPEADIQKVIKMAKDCAIDYEYFPEWHSVHLTDRDARIEIDSMNFWLKDLDLKYVEFNFDGLFIKGLGIESLKSVYEQAAEQAKKKSEESTQEHVQKFKILEKLQEKIKHKADK